MRIINQLSSAIYGHTLFRETYGEERPSGFTPFFRPTLKNFNDFILSMDKLLSENLNYDFFRGQVVLESERVREDGKVVVERRSSIALFEEWLRTAIKWQGEDEAVAAICGPLRLIRRRRKAPAHKLQENAYSKEYDDEQHTIFRNVYLGLMHLRRMLAKHPKAPAIDLPDYLAEGKIAFA